jgi:hypothetical protein
VADVLQFLKRVVKPVVGEAEVVRKQFFAVLFGVNSLLDGTISKNA